MRRTLVTMMLGCTMESGMDPFTSAGPGSSGGQDTTTDTPGTTSPAAETTASSSGDASGSTTDASVSSSSGEDSSSGEPMVEECPHDVVGKGACPGECTGGCDD